MVLISETANITSVDIDEMTISSPLDIPKMAEWSGFAEGTVAIWWNDNVRRGKKTLTLRKPIPNKFEDFHDA